MIKFSVNQPDKNKKYIKRTGAYALIINDKNLVAIVKTDTGYFLPGGGLDGKESLEECLKRECVEEIGAEIVVLDCFAQGNYYFYSTTMNVDMESIGHFFECKIIKTLDVLIEANHELVWMDLKQSMRLLYLDNQKEAVRVFASNYVY